MDPEIEIESRVLSEIAVAIQASGTALLAITLAYLSRLFPRPFARSWAVSWAALTVALVSVRLFIVLGGRELWAVFLVSEWIFLVALACGCRELARRGRPEGRTLLAAFLVASLLALVLVRFPSDFNALFYGQAVVCSGLFAFSFAALGGGCERSAGWQLMRVSLGLMTIAFLAYVPLYSLPKSTLDLDLRFLAWSPIADLLCEMLLGIGMVLVLSEEARAELTRVNLELRKAQGELETQARIDPLTEMLNRHAFQHLVRGKGGAQGATGTIVMVDVDHLKTINDEQGHEAGDLAIRGAARAIRELVRPEDLLFRWGGDEFLVVLPNVSLEVAEHRFAALDQGSLAPLALGGPPMPLRLSWGAAAFSSPSGLQQAIAEADESMYARRRARRAG